MSITRLRPKFTFTEDRLAELRAVVPEAFADGRLDFDVLREALGDWLEDDEARAEHFGLAWPGKRDARRLASLPSRGALVPAAGEGVAEDTTHNLFIEGDNLEVLKLILKSYAGQVKLIYIDPPYNTGNDFIYSDDFTDPLADYLRKTGQADERGQALTTNTKAGGRFHSNWLNMMYPRLLLARQLLALEGVLWISIDDGELPGLRLVCNEIFGEENFVATFIWQKRTTRENRRVFSFNHDYVVCYAKDKDLFEATRNLLPLSEEALGRYSNPDQDPRGPWQSVSLNAQAGHATPSQFYTITTPSGRRLDPPPGRCWSVTKLRLQELVRDNRIWFGAEGNNVPRLKVFLSDAREGLTPHTLWQAEEVGTTDSAKKALTELFDNIVVFDTVKPVELLQRIIHISTSPGDCILDFFAGSCTTAQAVLEQNRRDGGNRRFIMVQLPEPTENPNYPTIADIGKERIRRVIARLQEARAGQLDLGERETPEDLGFRVYTLAPSSFKPWPADTGDDIAAVEDLFARFESPLVDGWQVGNLLTEILLLEGFPLDSRITQYQPSADPRALPNRVLRVEADTVRHRLLVCLDATLHDATLARLDLRDDDILICLDTALTDEAKLRLSDQGNLKTI